MKKLFLAFFSAILIFTAVFAVNDVLIPDTYAAEILDSGDCGENVTWTLDDEGTLIISGTGDMWNLIHEHSWYPYMEMIKRVIIEEGVTTIGMAAFDGCSFLEEVNIPDSVTFIGQAAFRYCSALKKVNISKNSTLSHIERIAFAGCESLESAFIPSGVVIVEESIFALCTNLTEIIVDESNPNYISVDGVLYTSDKKTLVQYPGGKTTSVYRIPAGVELIEEGSFGYCYNITDIIFEENSALKEIDYFAFAECSNLQTIEIPASTEIIKSDAFDGCTNLTDVYYGSTEEDWNAIEIDRSNKCLIEANIHYSSVNDIPEDEDIPEYEKCDHMCHKEGFFSFIWKVINFFSKLFRINPVCECGVAHY